MVNRIAARNLHADQVGALSGIEARDHVMVSIRDTGLGIPEQHLEKIFDPYFTTNRRRLPRPDGPGRNGWCRGDEETNRDGSRVKAVVSSGYSEDAIISDHRSYGFMAFLKKPYTLEELNSVLQPLIDKRGCS